MRLVGRREKRKTVGVTKSWDARGVREFAAAELPEQREASVGRRPVRVRDKVPADAADEVAVACSARRRTPNSTATLKRPLLRRVVLQLRIPGTVPGGYADSEYPDPVRGGVLTAGVVCSRQHNRDCALHFPH